MRHESIGIGRRSSGITEMAAIDLFSTLFLIATLMIGPHAISRQVDPATNDAGEAKLLLSREGVFIGGEGPFAADEIATRLGGAKRQVRVTVAQSVSVEREHQVLAALTANPALQVMIDLAGSR